MGTGSTNCSGGATRDGPEENEEIADQTGPDEEEELKAKRRSTYFKNLFLFCKPLSTFVSHQQLQLQVRNKLNEMK